MAALPNWPAAERTPEPSLLGREALLLTFERTLARSSVMPFDQAFVGRHGVGKTAFLTVAEARARDFGWLTLRRELGPWIRTELRLADALIEDCQTLANEVGMTLTVEPAPRRRPHPVAVDRELESARERRPRMHRRDTPVERLADALRGLADALESKHARAVLFLDDAHYLIDNTTRDAFPLSLLVAVTDALREHPSGDRVRFVLAGVSTLAYGLGRSGGFGRRLFQVTEVAPLPLHVARELVVRNAPPGQSFPAEVVDSIASRMSGYPALILFATAFLLARPGCAEGIDAARLAAVERELLLALDRAMFDEAFTTCTPVERDVLLAMARRPLPVTRGALATRLTHVRNLEGSLRHLVDRAIVERTLRAQYDFAYPGFAGCLRRREGW